MRAKIIDGLLPGGRDVPFADVEAAVTRSAHDGRRRRRTGVRALTATVVVVGTQERLVPAADALEHVSDTAGLRVILLSEGATTEPIARVTDTAIAISGLPANYLNNAVAALRLSSLPAVVWWRGGSIAAFDDLAQLADRFIMDTEEPDAVWTHAVGLFDQTAVTDLRWTALTRWRSALAHLFDLPQVRRTIGGARTLTIAAADLPSARLFAGWLRSCAVCNVGNRIAIRAAQAGSTPLECVSLESDGPSVTVKRRATGTCLEASVGGEGSRIVPVGDGTLASLINEELGVRTRDLAFERALVAAREIAA